MSKARNMADLLDSNGDVVTGALDNVPPSNDASALTTGTLPVDRVPYLGRRNLIINGAMQVAQRGTSATGKTSSGYYTTDRFQNSMNALGTWTSEQSTDAPDGFSYSHKVTCTTADTPTGSDYFRIRYNMEGQDVQHFAFGTSEAKSLTLSFWVKSSNTGTFNCIFRTINTAVAERIAGGLVTINSADTWEYKTITVSGDTAVAIENNNGLEFNIEMWLNSGSTYSGTDVSSTWSNFAITKYYGNATLGLGNTVSDYFAITGVQLEVGSVATPFEHRSYGEELALCRRYYQQVGATFGIVRDDGGAVYFSVPHPEMRATPTLGQTDVIGVTDLTSNVYQSSASVVAYSENTNIGSFMRLNNFTGLTGYRSVGIRYVNSGYITLDAEL